MKNVKLLLAFAVGVVLTLALTDNLPGHITFRLPALHLVHWEDGVDNVFALLVLVVVAAFLLEKKPTPSISATPQGRKEKFFQSLRKLRRSQTDVWVGGVCGGLGEMTCVPAWIWRLGFLLAFTYYGAGIGAYILLYLFMPENSGAVDAAQAAGSSPRDGFFDFLRRFKRSAHDCQIGGVCGGLGEQTAVPSWIWRLGFTAAILCYGVGLVPYILLWVFVPESDVEADGNQQSPA